MKEAGRQTWLPASALPTFIYLVVFLVLPAGILFLYSFWTAGFFQVLHQFTLENYLRIFEQPLFLNLIIKSLGIGLLVAAVTVPVAFLIAYAITFQFEGWGNRILMLVMISMLSSYLVRIYAWKSILGPYGIINQSLMALGLIQEPLGFLLYGNFSVILTLTHILVPYAVLPIYSALQNIDHDLLEASRDLGASGALTFRRITLPLAMPGLISAFLFCFILASADYVTPQLVGGSSGMLVGRIIADQYGLAGNQPFGASLSLALMAGFGLVVGILAVGRQVLSRFHLGRRFRTPAEVRMARPGRLRRVLTRVPWSQIATWFILAFLYLPLVIVLVFSFNDSTAGIFPLKGFTLRWYQEVFASEAFLRSLRTSLLLGTVTALGALLIGAPAAFALTRHRFVLRNVLTGLIAGPIAVPGVVIGVALLSSVSFVGIQAGLPATAVAHILFTLPFVILVVQARLVDFDRSIEEAARDLGATRARTLRTITLPLMAPTLVAAGILVFALSLDEFIITNFVIGANSTLPVFIWGQMRRGISPAVNAVSTLILVGSLSLLSLTAIFMWRRQQLSQEAPFGVGATGIEKADGLAP